MQVENGNAGACGSTNADSAKIVALQTAMYGSGESCGKTVYITNTANGKSVTATVADGASPNARLIRLEAYLTSSAVQSVLRASRLRRSTSRQVPLTLSATSRLASSTSSGTSP